METYSFEDVDRWPKQAGIYAITCNGKTYVGRTERKFSQRWLEHVSRLRLGSHNNRYLQNAFRKYPEELWQLQVLEICDVACLSGKEAYWIEKLQAMHDANGYNLDTANATGSKLRSEETKRKISASKTGTKRPDLAKRNQQHCKSAYLVSPTGERVLVDNVRAFATGIGCHASCIYKLLSGRLKTAVGWKIAA